MSNCPEQLYKSSCWLVGCWDNLQQFKSITWELILVIVTIATEETLVTDFTAGTVMTIVKVLTKETLVTEVTVLKYF